MAPQLGPMQVLALAVARSHISLRIPNPTKITLKEAVRTFPTSFTQANVTLERTKLETSHLLDRLAFPFFEHSRFGLQGAVVAERPFRASGFQVMSPRMYCHKP
jgi:hypothetical protein